MKIISKMKRMWLVMVALACVSTAWADTQTVYSWESPDGNPVENGGTIVYTNGDGNRLNYANLGYYTICLNGKYGNMNDDVASANAGHMVLTLDEALQTGDVISVTAYRNKNADGKNVTIYFLFENGTEWKDTNGFVNICADDVDDDYDDDGNVPNTVQWTITDAEAGSKTITLTRNSASTNLFITKMTITREVLPLFNLTACNEAIAAAEAFKAALATDTYFEKEMIDELIVAIDEAIAYTQECVDMAASQDDVDITVNMLNETVGMYKNNYDAQIIGFKMEEVRVAGQETLAKYPEETRVDNAGLVEALMNLPMRTMGYTAEQLQAAVDAVEAAIPAFEKENNQVILNAAKKKATDYAATLNASEETGTMVQMEAYNGLTYYTSAAFFAESGITADSYDMVMAYSQQIDMMIAQYDPMIQKEKDTMAARVTVAEAQELLASYSNPTDNAGFAAAIDKVNEILSELNMWDTMYTIEDLNAAVDALATAQEVFVEENANEPVDSEQLPSGTYWLKNVASGKYLTGGNLWGTQASLAVHGLDMKVEVLENGKYTFDSNIPNGGTRHYLGSNGYMDSDVAEWAVIEVASQTYVITLDSMNCIGYDGSTSVVSLTLTDVANPATHWQFFTKDELIADMASATATNPVDATFFIVGQGFNRSDSNRNTAWQGRPAMGGNNDNFCAEKWNCNFDVYQDLTGLPNGFYKLSAQGYYRAGNGGATSMERHAYLYANEVSTPLQNINTEAGNEIFCMLTISVDYFLSNL